MKTDPIQVAPVEGESRREKLVTDAKGAVNNLSAKVKAFLDKHPMVVAVAIAVAYIIVLTLVLLVYMVLLAFLYSISPLLYVGAQVLVVGGCVWYIAKQINALRQYRQVVA